MPPISEEGKQLPQWALLFGLVFTGGTGSGLLLNNLPGEQPEDRVIAEVRELRREMHRQDEIMQQRIEAYQTLATECCRRADLVDQKLDFYIDR